LAGRRYKDNFPQQGLEFSFLRCGEVCFAVTCVRVIAVRLSGVFSYYISILGTAGAAFGVWLISYFIAITPRFCELADKFLTTRDDIRYLNLVFFIG
jgi:hypothetical protein